MSFAEVKVFQVLPDKLEAFEALVSDMTAAQKSSQGCRNIRYLKRFYTYDDGIQAPPRLLKKVADAVRYYSFWEFDSLEHYHEGTLQFFAQFEKPLRKLLRVPFDIQCGYTIGEV